MIAEDVDHGIHCMFPRAAAAARFLVIIPFGGLFAPEFSLIRGVHTPHEVMLTPMKRLALSAKPRVFLLRECSG